MYKFSENRRMRLRGTVMIVAMWIVLVLAGLVLVFARSMRVELLASANYASGIQADAVARAGLAFVMAEVDGTDGTYTAANGSSCEAVQVGNGYFWILDPNTDQDDATYVFGIRDENSRINLNSANTDMLLKLPGMTAELAASITDWRDADNDISQGGAESEYYLLQDDPYYCKNGPFESTEELLLVKDASAEFLYGEDINQNGILDPNENDADESDPADNGDGNLDRGVCDYVTVFSKQKRDTSAESKVDVNDRNTDALSDLLRSAVPESDFAAVMSRVRPGQPFRNILDFYIKTQISADAFGLVADRLTISQPQSQGPGEQGQGQNPNQAQPQSQLQGGLVNVCTAPRAVLLCLPDLEESNVDALIAKRQSAEADLANLAWVADALPNEKAVAIGGMITTRSYQFSADIVAVSADGRSFRRYRAVVDAENSPPRVLRWQNLTSFGWPLDPEILTELHNGEDISASSYRGGF